jgi:hypothetical protein
MEHDSPDARKSRRWSRFWTILIVVFGLPGLYILSFGPVLRFCSTKNPLGGNGRTVPNWVPIVYSPLMHAAFNRRGSPYSRYIGWWLNLRKAERLPVDINALRRLRSGTKQDEIKRRFGPPQEMYELYGEYRWFYYGTNSTKIVYVIFDTNMLYKRYEVDK